MKIILASVISFLCAFTSRQITHYLVSGYLSDPLKRLFRWPLFLATDLTITALIFPIVWCTVTSPLIVTTVLFCLALTTAALSDLTTQLLPRWCTLWMIPVGASLAATNYGFVSIHESIAGATVGYALLWGLELFYKNILKKDALGEGDKELLAMIGSFLGFEGMIASMIGGGLAGSLVGLTLISAKKMTPKTPLPLGFFMGLGSLFYLIVVLGNY